MADASPMIDKLLREPELSPLRVVFETELDASVDALLSGMELSATRSAIDTADG